MFVYQWSKFKTALLGVQCTYTLLNYLCMQYSGPGVADGWYQHPWPSWSLFGIPVEQEHIRLNSWGCSILTLYTLLNYCMHATVWCWPVSAADDGVMTESMSREETFSNVVCECKQHIVMFSHVRVLSALEEHQLHTLIVMNSCILVASLSAEDLTSKLLTPSTAKFILRTWSPGRSSSVVWRWGCADIVGSETVKQDLQGMVYWELGWVSSETSADGGKEQEGQYSGHYDKAL